MTKLKRVIASFAMIAILSTLVVSTTVSAGTYANVPSNSYYYDAVEALADIIGPTINPGANAPRSEVVRYVVGYFGLTGDVGEPTFTDVPKTHKAYEDIEIAAANGVISGYSGVNAHKFGPADPITREQVAKVVAVAMGLSTTACVAAPFKDVKVTDWACPYINALVETGVVHGYSGAKAGYFGPGDNVNYADSAVIVYQAVNAEIPADDDVSDDDVADDDDVAAAGELQVSLGEYIEGVTLPSGATSVKMLNVDVTAGEGGATLDSLQIHRFGVSALPANHAVYLYEGTDRLTSGKAINTTTNLATFGNLGLEVAAGETRHLTVRMDVGTVATTGEIGLEVASEESVDAGESTVALDGDVAGDKFGLSLTAAGIVTITKNGVTSNASVGEKGATIAKFRIAAATEEASLEEFGLYVGGTISVDDVVNLKLYASGVTDPIAEVEGLNSNDVAQFVMAEPYIIAKGDTKSFTVTAEFNTGRSADTVLTYVYEDTDVVAIGSTYGYGMAVVRTSYDGNTACTVAAQTACNAMALEGGDITIAGTAISNRNLSTNQDDVAVLKFSITAVSEVTFDNFVLALTPSVAADAANTDAGLLGTANGAEIVGPNFTDIKIKEVDGSFVWGPVDVDSFVTAAGGATAIGEATDAVISYYTFTDDLTFEAGESKDFEVTLDVENDSTLAEEQITASAVIAGVYPTVKDINNKTLTNATSLVPTSTYLGDQFTIKGDSLTVTKGTSVSSKTVVIGSEDVEIGSFSVGAGDASDVKITSISLVGYIDESSDGADFLAGADNSVAFSEEVLGMNLYKGSVSPENKLNASAQGANTTTGVVTFDNLSWEIAAGDTESLIVTADQIANNTAYNGDRVKVDIVDPTGDVVAENGDGNAITSLSADNPNGGITDTVATYAQISVSSGGTLAVDVNSPTAASDIIVAATTGNDMSTLKFTATQEAFIVSKMALRNASASLVNSDYDDNIAALHVNYFTDAAQTTAASTPCTLSSDQTIWLCTGMSMYVPNPDLVGNPNYALLNTTADLKSLANGAADAGDVPLFTFTPAGDFEATGVSSPTKVYEQTLLVTDLGAASYYVTSADMVVDTNELNEALDATETVITMDGATTASFPAGSIVCIDVGDTGSCGAAAEIFYVIAACTGADTPHGDCTAASEIVVKRGILGRTAAIAAITDDLYVINPTSVLATNPMSVYGTKLAFAAATPTHGGQSASEEVMEFTITPNVVGDAKIRAGLKLDETTTALASTDAALDVTNAETIGVNTTTVEPSGTSVELLCTAALSCDTSDGVGIDYGALGTLSTYNYVGFWFQWHDAAGAVALPADDLEATLSAAAVGGILQSTPVAFGVAATTYTEDLWYYKEFPISGFVSDATQDRWFVVGFKDGTATAQGDTIWIDDIKFYNEKIFVDLSTNATGVVGGTTAYLMQNGDPIATGNAVFKSTTAGSILFTPIAADGFGDITLSGTDTFTVEMNTVQLANSTSTESLTTNVDLGGYGTATGDVYWYDEEGASELTWAGKNGTDKVSNTISW